MDESANALSGQCLCGGVRLRAVPEALHADACHCGMCRRWGGGPVMTINCGSRLAVEQGDALLRRFDSSDWALRGFCGDCGSHLFYWLKPQDLYFVPVGLFGPVEGLTFATEIFIDSKPAWYDFANPTRKMTEADVMAAFGAG